MDYKKLYDLALDATKNAYTPYSHFNVGAALLTEEGTVYTGVNIENSSYGGTICAERTAMVKAISEGHRRFKALAVAAVSEGKEHTSSPCGICRQFIFEFGDDIDIIFGSDRDNLEVYKIKDLLPAGFRL
ncbi:MAG: cytidine deaminase [Firmicutes bacterium]|nr:cytidine deaminase [Clostridiales bacterium]MBQ4339869.1 cytidine deaminase [Bacillota bacterium]